MKRFFLSAILFVGLAVTASAQSNGTIGVKAGFNYANIEGKNIDLKYRPGFTAGFFLNAPLAADGALSLQQEVLFSVKGAKSDEDGVKENLRLGYLDVPLLLRYKKGNFFGELGPQGSALITTKYKIEIDDFEATTTKSQDLGLKTFEISGIVGVGYQMENGIQAGLRYNRGISKLFRGEEVVEGNKAHHSVFQLYVGYAFGSK